MRVRSSIESLSFEVSLSARTNEKFSFDDDKNATWSKIFLFLSFAKINPSKSLNIIISLGFIALNFSSKESVDNRFLESSFVYGAM